MDVSTAFAVVYAGDGSRHKLCWTADDVVDATTELAAPGGRPVVFHRRGAHASVVNIAPAGFTGVQARDIRGGVRIG